MEKEKDIAKESAAAETQETQNGVQENVEQQEVVVLKEISDAVLDTDLKDFAILDDYLQIHEEGRKYKTLLTPKFKERKKWVAPNPNEIRTHIPGVVGEIMVKKRDAVKKGEKLLIYEAMKMKNVVTAPFDGVIKRIAVKEGEKLPKGALLIVMGNNLKSK